MSPTENLSPFLIVVVALWLATLGAFAQSLAEHNLISWAYAWGSAAFAVFSSVAYVRSR